MTGPHSDASSARPITVAELLAKNGTIGSPPVTGRRRRRRNNSDAVTVAELTGEIPVIRDKDDHESPETAASVPAAHAHRANGTTRVAEPSPEQLDDDLGEGLGDDLGDDVADDDVAEEVQWPAPEPRWPVSGPQSARDSRPERSHDPRPGRTADGGDPGRREVQAGPRESESGAEKMSPDPVDNYGGTPVDVMDTEVAAAEFQAEDSAYVRSYLRGSETMFRGREPGRRDEPAKTADARRRAFDGDPDAHLEEDPVDDFVEVQGHRADGIEEEAPTRAQRLRSGGLMVLQSILAVAFGGGLFIAFDQLWRWNNIVALVLSVLVTLGLVAGVQVVRKTVDIGSTLIAVVVGLLVTLGPLVLYSN